MKKVLLTGAFGNIGPKVIDELLTQNYQVICFDLDNKNNRKVSRSYANKVEAFWGDITNAEQVAQAVAPCDAVIHNAALLPHLVTQNPGLAEKVNVGGTENIINAIKASDKKPQLVFPSSISVHGYHMPEDETPKRIDSPFKAEDDYASHKIACEKLLDDCDINWTVVRIGACLDSNSKIGGDDIRLALEGMFNAHPQCRIEYVHTKDVAKAQVNAIGNEKAYGKKFFLGGGDRCRATWHDFNSIGFEAMGLSKPPVNYFNHQSGYYTDWMDTAEAQEVLQFQQHTLEDYKKEFEKKFKLLRIFGYPVRPLLKNYLYGMSPYKG